MLFNSQEFLFVFLPVTLLGFYLLGPIARQWAILWLILMSLLFYGWWRPVNILIIGPSIIINYLLASYLLKLSERGDQPGRSRVVLLLGILFNVLFLGFFKYADFVYGTINDVFGANFILLHVILPLGISFITFQKIAFLIDVQAGRVKAFTFREYCTFVLFFPQLVAGPIVHYREMMPQFAAATCRFDKENFAVGLTLLFFGLFKKGVLADNIAPLVTPIYEHSAAAGHTPFLLAWLAALGFTLQLYFDFSGYTDMALGLGRFFGIKLPPNFNSPLKATSIIEFWLRWHMTLTRFLTAYLYNPLVLWMTRRRAIKGRPGFGGRNPSVGAFASLLMVPLITTMFISGLWHGAGLWIRHLGPHPWRLSRHQSWLASLCCAPVEGSGRLRPVDEAGGFRPDIRRRHDRDGVLSRDDSEIGGRPGQRRLWTEWDLDAARRCGDRRNLWDGHQARRDVGGDPAVHRSRLSQHAANPRSLRTSFGREAGLDRANHRKIQHSRMGPLAAVGSGDIGHRRGRDLFHGRPERVPLLAVLALLRS